MALQLIPQLDRDGKLVVAASAIRSLDYSFLSVFLGVYLTLLHFSALQAGLVFSGIMAGGALSNAVASWRGDAIGRRRMLVVMAALMAVGGALFAFSSSVAMLMLIGLFAMTSATGGDRTAFMSLDTAILAQTTDASSRTAVFSWYSLLGMVAKAVGTLLIAVPSALQSQLGMAELASFKTMFAVYAVIAVSGIALYARLSPKAELQHVYSSGRPKASADSRNLIVKLAAISSLDALGGGFVARGFVSYWFANQYGAELGAIAAIFFVGQLLNAVSVWLALPSPQESGCSRRWRSHRCCRTCS